MRRGIGISGDVEIDQNIAEMNILLEDRTWWNASNHASAQKKFSKVIVDAF